MHIEGHLWFGSSFANSVSSFHQPPQEIQFQVNIVDHYLFIGKSNKGIYFLYILWMTVSLLIANL